MSMNRLTTLPNEILIDIVGELPREDLFKSCLVSRVMSEISQYLLYRQINLQLDQIIPFMRVVISKPRLGTYVRDARITWKEFREGDSLWDRSESISDFCMAGIETVSDKVLITAHAKQFGCTTEMQDAISRGDNIALVLLVLMTLENLEYLQVVMRRLAVSFRGYLAELLSSKRFLSKLTRFECAEVEYDKDIPKFGRILDDSSIQEVTSGNDATQSSSAAPRVGILSQDQLQSKSNLMELTIRAGRMDFDSILNLIEVSRHLSRFTFRYKKESDSKYGKSPNIEHVRKLTESLSVHSRSLRRLSLLPASQSLPLRFPDNAILGDITHFNVLEILDVPGDLLLGQDPNNPRILHQLLPRSLKDLYLGAPVINTPYAFHNKWSNEQIFNEVIKYAKDLSLKCPQLKAIETDHMPDNFAEEELVREIENKWGIVINFEFFSSRVDMFFFNFPVADRKNSDVDSDPEY